MYSEASLRTIQCFFVKRLWLLQIYFAFVTNISKSSIQREREIELCPEEHFGWAIFFFAVNSFKKPHNQVNHNNNGIKITKMLLKEGSQREGKRAKKKVITVLMIWWVFFYDILFFDISKWTHTQTYRDPKNGR